MKRNKKPAFTVEEPTYPSVEDVGIDRRRFLAILGGGAAATAIFAGCNKKEHERVPGQEPIARLPGSSPVRKTAMEGSDGRLTARSY